MTEAGSAAGSRRITVESDPPEMRLDRYLAMQFADMTRSRIVQLIDQGHVRVNGEAARKSTRPAPGAVIEVDVPEPEPSEVVPEPIPLTIVYQDRDLAVVDKPAGLVVHPAPGNWSGTLVHALLHHLDDLSGIGGVMRPGIVHRLDKDTSGLLLVAKHDRAHHALSAALRKRHIHRAYVLAAWGHLKQDEITVEAAIARARRDRKRMAVTAGGRPAVTRFRRVERWPAADLLRAELETGRTHQIRVHLESIGHPVVGDAVYAHGGARAISGPARQWALELERRVSRQFLHAAELAFAHPRTGTRMHFESRLPPDLAGVAEWARG